LSVEYRYSSPAACPKRNAGRGFGECGIVTEWRVVGLWVVLEKRCIALLQSCTFGLS